MKLYYINRIIAFTLPLMCVVSCEDALDEEPFSELVTETLLVEEQGILGVLSSAYAGSQQQSFGYEARVHLSELSTGSAWQQAGAWEGNVGVPFTEFTWTSGTGVLGQFWNAAFQTIRDANIVINNIELGDFSDDFRSTVVAEAKALRGHSYADLFSFFGPVPIIITSESTELVQPQGRSSEAEVLQQIENDLLDAINALPDEQPVGKVTRGAAMGVLCKHYLNTKQWQKSADLAEDIIDMGVYSLIPSYSDLFDATKEGSSEFLWILPRSPVSFPVSNHINALGLPTDFGVATFAARVFFFDDFFNAFETGDTRIDNLIPSYTNTAGELITGLGNDQSVSLKYLPDPAAPGVDAGNDVALVRYADILLSRAEALNELNGPNQESIDLINEVRSRAGITSISVGGFDQSGLRDFILEERRFEFYYEDKRREDLIRHSKFISEAQARGKSAQDFHRLFPIPQAEIDANSNPDMEQNPGY